MENTLGYIAWQSSIDCLTNVRAAPHRSNALPYPAMVHLCTLPPEQPRILHHHRAGAAGGGARLARAAAARADRRRERLHRAGAHGGRAAAVVAGGARHLCARAGGVWGEWARPPALCMLCSASCFVYAGSCFLITHAEMGVLRYTCKTAHQKAPGPEPRAVQYRPRARRRCWSQRRCCA